jgi:hypothetical protein
VTSGTLKRVQGDACPAKWQKSLARFRKAQAAIEAAAHTPDEDLYDRLVDRFSAALRSLLRTPAPDLPAFVTKLDLAVDEDVATLTGGEACMATLKRDARRLAGL